jgi:nucleoside-diphosphate-sugar epimerase
VDKARERIGYAPRFPLDQGIAKYIGWYKEIMAQRSEGGKIGFIYG